MMTEDRNPSLYPMVVPHAYQAWRNPPAWRTCRLCGRGANAMIHRAGYLDSTSPALVDGVSDKAGEMPSKGETP